MNCVDFQQQLHAFLDGIPLAGPEAEAHLAVCPDCRELHVSAQRLHTGLRLLVVPQPPTGLTERIVAAVLADRRRLSLPFRRVLTAGALAASLLLMTFAGPLGPRPVFVPGEAPPVALGSPAPSLQEDLGKVSELFASLTRRTTDETVGQSRLLWPTALPELPMPDGDMLQVALDPPAQSLREVQQSVSEGLEPVTESWRRAVNLFRRNLPMTVSETE